MRRLLIVLILGLATMLWPAEGGAAAPAATAEAGDQFGIGLVNGDA